MIEGRVEGRQAYVPVAVYGPDEQEADIEFVLDTGFTAEATLPPDMCDALGLAFLRVQSVDLAGEIPFLVSVYQATLLWDDIERAVEILSIDGAPLLGMGMFAEFEVCLQVKNGGRVTLKAL